MIICNGVVGLCILVGGLAHREQSFRVEGAGAGLAALIVMSTLTLVFPVFTTSTAGGTYSNPQLAFVALTSTALWGIFVFIQTVRHRDYFIPVEDAANLAAHAEPPTTRLGLDELRLAVRLAGGGRGPGQDALAHDRAGRSKRPVRPGPTSES